MTPLFFKVKEGIFFCLFLWGDIYFLWSNVQELIVKLIYKVLMDFVINEVLYE